jgi:subtilisin family serine protease
VVVAVVDTGVNYAHPDLAANMWIDPQGVSTHHGADVIGGAADPMDLNGHGTHVAGIIGAVGNNAAGVSGVCWKASIMAVRVLDAGGMGTSATVASGVGFAASHGARVINLSLGFPGQDDYVSRAIASATAAGAVVVASAGNDGVDDDGPDATYPCADTNPAVLCVAALDATFALASFSNWGAHSVDVGAPGVNIVSAWPGAHSVQTLAFGTGATFTSTWTLSSTTGAGWSTYTSGGTTYLADPASYFTSAAKYPAGTTDRAYRTIDTSGADAAALFFGAEVDLASNDWLRVWCSPSGGSPFSSIVVEEDKGLQTGGQLVPFELDLTRCMTANTTVGVELQSTGTASGYGIAVTPLQLRKLTLNPPQPQYDTISGTSMAAPVVAGVAALVLAYQPAFTPADVVGAITGGGRPVASLAGRTTSGNVVQAYGALRHVNPPRGLAATIH